MSNWVLEMQRWGPTINTIVYKGSPQYRKTLQPMLRSRKFNVLLTTYEYVIKDKAALSKVLCLNNTWLVSVDCLLKVIWGDVSLDYGPWNG